MLSNKNQASYIKNYKEIDAAIQSRERKGQFKVKKFDWSKRGSSVRLSNFSNWKGGWLNFYEKFSFV